MPVQNTAPITISMVFQDLFTGPAAKALEQFKTNAETVFQAVASAGVTAFEQIQSAQEKALKPPEHSPRDWIDIAVNGLVLIQTVLTAIVAMDLPLDNLRKRYTILATALSQLYEFILPRVILGFEGLVATLLLPVEPLAALLLAVTAFTVAWASKAQLAEITVGGKPVKEYFRDAFEFWLSGGLTAKLKGSFEGLTRVCLPLKHNNTEEENCTGSKFFTSRSPKNLLSDDKAI